MSESGKIITYNVSQDLNSVILILSGKTTITGYTSSSTSVSRDSPY